MNDEERGAVLDRAEKNLRAAGFDNVVILANEGGSHGTIGIACYTKPALMRLLDENRVSKIVSFGKGPEVKE